MSRNAFYFSFALLAVLAIGIALSDADKAIKSQHQGEKLLPGLQNELDKVTRVTITQGENTTTLVKKPEGWKVEERFNYAANETRLFTFLRAIASAEIREQKTSKPENYPRLGLGDDGLKVKIAASKSYSIEIGDPAKQRNGRYVLLPKTTLSNSSGDNKATNSADGNPVWLSNLQTNVVAAPQEWINPSPITVDRANISRVALSSDGVALVATRNSDGVMVLENLPPDATLKYPGVASSLLDGISNFRVEDVKLASALPLAFPHSASFSLKDNSKIELELNKIDSVCWVRFLDQGLSNWVFKISDSNYASLTRTLADMLKETSSDKS